MSEFEFLRQAYESLQEAQRLDKVIQHHNPKAVDKAVSACVENIIYNYLQMKAKS